MHARRGTRLAGLLVAATLLPAQAVMAGLPNDILTGLNLLDYRFQLQKNYLGKGWDFDTAAFYSGQTFRFGLADLTLGATSPSSVAISTGFTTRGLPAARFSMTTSQPLSYTLNANYGFQDLTTTGNILIDIDTTINALGFYDLTFQLSNRGTFQTEGFAGADQGTLDFDAGPIVVSGNLYADVLAVLTQPFFTASGTENPFAKFSQKAVRGLPEGMDLNSITDLTAVGSDDIGRAVNIHLQTAEGFSLPGDTSETSTYFDEDIVEPRVVLDADGFIAIPEGPGLGARVMPERVLKRTIAAERLR